MDENQKQIIELKTKISNLESELTAAKRALFELDEEGRETTESFTSPSATTDPKIIEGTFDGENMVGPGGKIYPVPANYASKSKLIEGDTLKLTIGDDGSFVFKQIGPAQRKKLTGTLRFADNVYLVNTGDRDYHVLYASVTYHKAKPDDRVAIVTSTNDNAKWCVLESIIHELSPEDRTAATSVVEDRLADEMKSPLQPNDLLSIPSDARVAPNYEEKTAEEQAKNNLGIDDLQISGPRGTITPEAVKSDAPFENNNPATIAAAEPPQTNSQREDSISELEI